jgi:hypothetical protein
MSPALWKTAPSAPSRARAYVAGLGATGALVGAAVIAVLTVGAVVAFDGDARDATDSERGTVFAGAGGTVTALAPPSGEAGRDGGGDAAGGGGDAAGGGGGAAGDKGMPGGAETAPGAGGEGTPGGSLPPAPSPAPVAPPPGGAAPPTSPGSGTGPVGGAVGQIDDAAGGLGLDPGLGEITDPITGPVDETLQDPLPGSGSLPGSTPRR